MRLKPPQYRKSSCKDPGRLTTVPALKTGKIGVSTVAIDAMMALTGWGLGFRDGRREDTNPKRAWYWKMQCD